MLSREKMDRLDQLLVLCRDKGEMADVARFDAGRDTAVAFTPAFARRRAANVRRYRRMTCAPRPVARGKRVGLGVLIAAALILSLTLTAAAVYPDAPLWQDIAAFFGLDARQSGQIELLRGQVSGRYDSVEEALAAGHYPVMYPTTLPDGVTLKRVLHVHHGEESDYELLFVYEGGEMSYSVYSDMTKVPEALPGRLELTVNGIPRILLPITDQRGSRFQASWREGTFGYILTCEDLGSLLRVMQDMKGGSQ